MSSSIPAQNAKGKNISCSVMCNAGIKMNSSKYSHISDIHTVNNCKIQEKEKERENSLPRRLGNDDIIASSKSDVNLRATLSDGGINKLVAGKRFMLRKQSLSYSVGSSGKLCKAYERLVSLIAV